MYAAHRRISKKEEVVGWYSTTAGKEPKLITNTSSVINNFYTKQCDDELPIHLVVDSTLSGDTMGIRGFVAKAITLDDQTFADMFEEVAVEVVMSDAETTAIFHMMLGENKSESGSVPMQAWENTDIVSMIPSNTESITTTVELLLKTIDELSAYVDNVVDGKADSMPAVGVALSQALASLQNYNKDQISAQLQDKVQDLAMISYLSTLLKTQLKVSDKIHSIL